MRIKITERGSLLLERAGKFKLQLCPYVPDPAEGTATPCGDWCPQFNTVPYIPVDEHNAAGYVCQDEDEDPYTLVHLCQGATYSIYPEDFIDERKQYAK